MYGAVRCFLIEVTDQKKRFARCYDHSSEDSTHKCSAVPEGYHNICVYVDTVNAPLDPDGYDRELHSLPEDYPFPTHCACGREFGPSDRQTFTERLWRRTDTGELFTLKEAPPGSIYRASWMEPQWAGADGHSYVAICPNGRPWNIDGPASNCTMPGELTHRCWIRHGAPPNFTVDKNGHTCAAGAGSIQAGDYHGFLRNGVFTKG